MHCVKLRMRIDTNAWAGVKRQIFTPGRVRPTIGKRGFLADANHLTNISEARRKGPRVRSSPQCCSSYANKRKICNKNRACTWLVLHW
jgi:hypothetical protein